MGTINKQGTCKDRKKFAEALRVRLQKMRSGPLANMKEEWQESGSDVTATLKGMGITVEFTLKGNAWTCTADYPFLMPRSVVESIIDKTVDDLKAF